MANKKVLLLGAGFTANFGAPVSSQVWNDLFNYPAIQKNVKLRSALKRYQENGDFEGFFEEIVYGVNSTEEEKIIVATAVIEIYKRINAHTESMMIHGNSSGVCFQKLMCFLKRFSNMEQGKGFIFTLNQDLFLEKLANKYLRKDKRFSDFFIAYPAINVPYVDPQWKSQLPSKEWLDNWLSKPNLRGNLHVPRKFPLYVKLHGSSGWIHDNGKTSIPVIGKNKSKQILQEPLLNWYVKLFEQTLDEAVDIWVIGYSFSDKHINEILMGSMQKHRSSLYVIDTKTHNDFMKYILSFNSTLYGLIDNQLHGYFPCYLKQIFPSEDLSNLSYYCSIMNQIFNEDNTSIKAINDVMVFF